MKHASACTSLLQAFKGILKNYFYGLRGWILPLEGLRINNLGDLARRSAVEVSEYWASFPRTLTPAM